MNAPTPISALNTMPDTDPQETAEWRDAFAALVAAQGPERARFILDELARAAHARRVGWQPELNTPMSTPSPRSSSRCSRATWRWRSAWPA